jgi:hypothetical protein
VCEPGKGGLCSRAIDVRPTVSPPRLNERNKRTAIGLDLHAGFESRFTDLARL